VARHRVHCNRFAHDVTDHGVFRAQLTLPACISGRRESVKTADIGNTTLLPVPLASES
jgi:hypothetical protein